MKREERNFETFNEITEDFIPIESSHWRQEILDLSSFFKIKRFY